MSKDVETDYIIPEPYAEEGTIWGGTFKLRNVIEGVIGAGIFIMIVLMFPLGIKATALLSTILGIPMLVLGTVGLNNGPLSEFIVDAFRYIKSPRVYEYKALVAPEVPDTEEEEKQTKASAAFARKTQVAFAGKPKRKSKRKSKGAPKKSDGTLAEPDSTLKESSGVETRDVSQDELEDECDIPAGFFSNEEVSTFQTEEVSTFQKEEVEIEQEPEQEPEQGRKQEPKEREQEQEQQTHVRATSVASKEDKIRMLELELEILKQKFKMEEKEE